MEPIALLALGAALTVLCAAVRRSAERHFAGDCRHCSDTGPTCTLEACCRWCGRTA